MTDNQNTAVKAKRRRLRIHEITAENDMRYRGPLSFQHFQILGWLCIVISQVVVLLKLGGRFDPVFATDTAALLGALNGIANMSLPFLLIANFAQILNADNGYRGQIIKNGAATVAICGVFYAVFYRYIVGSFAAIITKPAEALPTVDNAIRSVGSGGFVAFNLFLDLFLCTLAMLFLNYTPRRCFKGKAIILFRLLTLLPIGYEVACMLLKVQAARGMIEIPAWAFPLLPMKPPMTFVLFVALAIFVKTRELRFRRHGKTHEEYQAFLKTNRNSWNFSVFLAIMMVVVSLIDFVVVVGFSVNETVTTAMSKAQAAVTEAAPQAEGDAAGAARALGEIEALPTPENPGQPQATEGAEASETEGDVASELGLDDAAINAAVEKGMHIGLAVGFGGSVYLLFLAPFVLLFSYTRRPKYPMAGLLIPVVAIALIVIIYLEGFHQLLYQLPIEKIDLGQMSFMIQQYAALLQ